MSSIIGRSNQLISIISTSCLTSIILYTYCLLSLINFAFYSKSDLHEYAERNKAYKLSFVSSAGKVKYSVHSLACKTVLASVFIPRVTLQKGNVY